MTSPGSGVRSLVRPLWRAARRGVACWHLGTSRQCSLCLARVGRFLPYRGGRRAQPAVVAALAMVGSDVDQFECPCCGAHDRERHVWLYLQASKLLERQATGRVVHFAPERRLGPRLRALSAAYTACDLFPADASIERADITAMPFPAGSVDLLVANHVLEHVDDDLRALDEIARVLRPGGCAVLQTPYSAALTATWSDPGIAAPQARLHAYGQEDHVRLYGRDIFERFASRGLVSRVVQHAELLSGVDARQAGVNPAEPFFLFHRPG